MVKLVLGLTVKKPLTSTPPVPLRMVGPVVEFSVTAGSKPKLKAVGLTSLRTPLLLIVSVVFSGPIPLSEGLPLAAPFASSTIRVAPEVMLMVS